MTGKVMVGRYLGLAQGQSGSISAPRTSGGSSSAGSDTPLTALRRRNASGDVEMQLVPAGNGSNAGGINGVTGVGERADNVLGPEGAGARDGADDLFAREDGDDGGAGKQEKKNNTAEEVGLLARPAQRGDAVRQGLLRRLRTGTLSKLKALGSRTKSLFSTFVHYLKCCCCCASTDQDGLPLTQEPPPPAASTDLKEWRESVEKALTNPMTVSHLVYFGSMTMCLTILFAMRRDTNARGVDKAAMTVEMIFCFSIVTISLYKLLSLHSVQTTAPRLTRWYERTNALMFWSFTSGWMTIYTTRIPHEVFCWWMWIILGFFLSVVAFITVSVGCLGRVRERQVIYIEPVRGSQE